MFFIDRLKKISQKKSRIVAGIISGTSVDRISVAICRIEGCGINPGTKVKLLKFKTIPYKKDTRLDLLNPLKLNARQISILNVQVGHEFSAALLKTARQAGIELSKIDLIGSHGQTIYHHSTSNDPVKSSLQIGDGDIISYKTGIITISDFRMRDIAAGGEGAPLTPYSDAILYNGLATSSSKKRAVRRAILNLGGIANITFLSGTKSRITGFDCGPANAPLDRLARLLSNGRLQFDKDGKIARSGKINRTLVDSLIKSDPYFNLPPPKSTGPEKYGDDFIRKAQKLNPNRSNQGLNADLIASVSEFCARAVNNSLTQFREYQIEELVLAGGGSYNRYLIERISECVKPVRVIFSDDLGVPVDAREAMAFAIFANDAACGEQTALTKVTGAQTATILGKVSF